MTQTSASAAVHGSVADGFEAVWEAFAENFMSRGELGAAFAVTVDGVSVVDLWGGVADVASASVWDRDTLQVVFSGAKALVAVCLLILVVRGELELSAPVQRYWPEFAANGKRALRVIDLASHNARLPGFRSLVVEDELLDDHRMAALLAEQPMDEDPRAANVYHALTYGWLCGEVIRRIDGRSVGGFFREEVAEPLGLEVWIGLPPEAEERVSTLYYAPSWGQGTRSGAHAISTDELLARVWHNPPLFPPGHIPWNRNDFHAAEIPGAGAIGTARSLARLYGCLARGGELDGIRLFSPATLAIGRREVTRRHEPLLDEPQAFGVGFALQTELGVFGRVSDAFGHSGAGGSVHCAWPSEKVGISYTMNVMRDDESVDPRAQALLNALQDVLRSGQR